MGTFRLGGKDEFFVIIVVKGFVKMFYGLIKVLFGLNLAERGQSAVAGVNAPVNSIDSNALFSKNK
jgi:hypothetical protein